MLSVEELEHLLVDIESDRVERKESLRTDETRNRVRQAICAFANDLPDHRQPGVLFIGASDDGTPTGLAITDELLRTLSQMKDDGNIQPFPSIQVRKANLKGIDCAVVEVLPADWPPVRYQGQVWIRVGPQRAIATPQEELRLSEKRLTAARTFDLRPCRGSDISDLLIDEFSSEYLPRAVSHSALIENGRSEEQQLASLRLFDLRSGCPTNAGILVFGRDPLPFIPGAHIQLVRFDGLALTDGILDSKDLTGNLFTQLLRLNELLPLQIRTARGASKGMQHADHPDYPLAAIRELVLNAIMHRDYELSNAPVQINWFSDRIEVKNPGGLFGQVSPSNFGTVNDYRNPVIAEAMKILGYVERFGVGIARARKALTDNGNPHPDFTFEANHVLVTIRSAA